MHTVFRLEKFFIKEKLSLKFVKAVYNKIANYEKIETYPAHFKAKLDPIFLKMQTTAAVEHNLVYV